MIKNLKEEFRGEEEKEVLARVQIGNKTFTNDHIYNLVMDFSCNSGQGFTLGSTFSNSAQIVLIGLVEGLTELSRVNVEIGLRFREANLIKLNEDLTLSYPNIDSNEVKIPVKQETVVRIIETRGSYLKVEFYDFDYKVQEGWFDTLGANYESVEYCDQYHQVGSFRISERVEVNRNTHRTTIECLDDFINMEGEYKSHLAATSMRDLAINVAQSAGVMFNHDNFIEMLPTTLVMIPPEVTHREMIGFISGLVGGFAYFNSVGQLEIRRFKKDFTKIHPTEYHLGGFRRNDIIFKPQGYVNNIKQDGADNLVQTRGEQLGNQIVTDNLLMTESLLDKVWEKVKDIEIHPFELTWWGTPFLEVGTWITVEDNEGNEFDTIALSHRITFTGGLRYETSANIQSVPKEVVYTQRNPDKGIIGKYITGNEVRFLQTSSSVVPQGSIPTGNLPSIGSGQAFSLDESPTPIPNQFIHALTRITFSDRTFSQYITTLRNGGEDGVGVSSISTYYIQNTHPVPPLETSNLWVSETPPTPLPNHYIHALTRFTKSDGSTASSTYTIINGEDGKDGIGIKSTVIHYAIHNNGVEPPLDNANWMLTIPKDYDQGDWLWTRTTVTLDDNTITKSFSVSRDGEDGQDGANGINGVDGEDGVGIRATIVHYAVNNNGIVPPSSSYSWTTNIPTVRQGEWLWTRTRLIYDDDTHSDSFSPSRQAVDGAKGEDGKDGINGQNGADGQDGVDGQGFEVVAPHVPQGLSAWASHNSISVQWHNHVNDANLSFEAQFRATNTANAPWVDVYRGNATRFVHQNIPHNTQRWYRVRSRNVEGRFSQWTTVDGVEVGDHSPPHTAKTTPITSQFIESISTNLITSDHIQGLTLEAGTVRGGLITGSVFETSGNNRHIDIRSGNISFYENGVLTQQVNGSGTQIYANNVDIGYIGRSANQHLLFGVTRGRDLRLSAQVNEALGTYYTRLRIDGTSGDLTLFSPILSGSLRPNGFGVATGAFTFFGTGDVTVSSDRVLRTRRLGTSGFVGNTDLFHVPVSFNTEVAASMLRSQENTNASNCSGIHFGRNGVLRLGHRGVWRSLDVSHMGTRNGSFTVGDFYIYWGGVSIAPNNGNLSSVTMNISQFGFRNAPTVQVTALSSASGGSLLGYGASDVSTSSVTFHVRRTGTTNTHLMYLLIGRRAL